MSNFASAKSITFFDIETTHLDPKCSAILQISFITDWEDGRQDTWTTKIKPKDVELKFASKNSLEICNYSEEKWRDAPNFEKVASEIAKRLMWGPIVAHNINFDLSHIRAIFRRYGWKEVDRISDEEKCLKIGYPVIDTCALSYLFLPPERQSLNVLREYYQIPTEGAHESHKDTEDCRYIFYNIMGEKFNS